MVITRYVTFFKFQNPPPKVSYGKRIDEKAFEARQRLKKILEKKSTQPNLTQGVDVPKGDVTSVSFTNRPRSSSSESEHSVTRFAKFGFFYDIVFAVLLSSM